jgi:hypothetical protein
MSHVCSLKGNGSASHRRRTTGRLLRARRTVGDFTDPAALILPAGTRLDDAA